MIVIRRRTKQKINKSVSLSRYINNNKYIFPVKGAWQIDGNFDCIPYHRQRHVDEFAFDLCKLDKNLRLSKGENTKEDDYPCYGEEVYAIADGTVVKVYNNFDVNTIGKSSDELKQLEHVHGQWPVICGNFVTIKHSGGECSTYAHLIYKSIRVKPGDKVKQGQIIGLVGNTGLSSCPHLHFELRYGNTANSRGLPCCFTNIIGTQGEKIDLITEEYTIVHAE